MVDKIATAEEIQSELKAIWAMTEEEKPSREKLAGALELLAERVNSSVTASSGYTPHFSKFVECVDAFAEGLKKVTQAKIALVKIGTLVRNDPDVEALEGMNKFAPEQQLEYLQEALETAEKAVKYLVEQYDTSNAAYLRMGLK
jgi:hypothetical protein